MNAHARINSDNEKIETNTICTVYFDGACPLCAKEIATYQTWRGADKIEWIDASRCAEVELGTQLNRQQALNKLHARDETGQLVSGAAAFIVMWRQLPALRWITPLLERRWVTALLDYFYDVFLKLRPLWRKPTVDEIGR
jgi:predicted DCC family thiol-disulfide oxidoreductase YuxK